MKAAAGTVGDWIEIGHSGACALSVRARFNGVHPDTVVEVKTAFDEGDAPQGGETGDEGD